MSALPFFFLSFMADSKAVLLHYCFFIAFLSIIIIIFFAALLTSKAIENTRNAYTHTHTHIRNSSNNEKSPWPCGFA